MNDLPSRNDIIRALQETRHGPPSARDLARSLKVDRDAYRSFRRLLRSMESDGEVFRQRKGRYALPGSFEIVTGVVDVTRAGDGFVMAEAAGEEDVYVPRRHLGSAVDGDRVAVRVERHVPGRNPEGRLVRVLERAWGQVVGVYHHRRGYGAVVPQEPPLPADIFVPEAERGEAADGDIVLVHNGVIENFQSLKDELVDQGYQFNSDTDSEVVAHLLAETLKQTPEVADQPNMRYLTAVQATVARLRGTYGLAIAFREQPNLCLLYTSPSPRD